MKKEKKLLGDLSGFMIQNVDQNVQSRDEDGSQDMMDGDIGEDPAPSEAKSAQPALIQSQLNFPTIPQYLLEKLAKITV